MGKEIKENMNKTIIPKWMYTLENYVVGNNEFVYEAVQAVIKNPGRIYTPLIIYGKNGDGKTHLLHAIEDEIKKDSTLNVKYITTEQFVADAVKALKNKEEQNYISLFKNIDVLLVDDFQFLSGKELIQKLFFDVFSAMIFSYKQVVITGDALPEKMDINSEKFKYYLDMGLYAGILESDYNTRLEILKRKVKEANFQIEEECLEYTAREFKGSNGRLIGLLERIIVLASLDNPKGEIDYEFIDRNIKFFENAEHKEELEVNDA